MPQIIFVNYREYLKSYEVANKMHLGLFQPGRVRGFDSMVVSGLNISISHSDNGIIQTDKVPTDPTSTRGIIFTKQGCIIQMDSALVFVGTSNFLNSSVRIELLVCQHTYISSVGGAPASFSLQSSTYTPANNEIIVGKIITPASTADYTNSIYIPESHDIPAQNKFLKVIEKLQKAKSIISNTLNITVNDPEVLITTTTTDLYYISSVFDKNIEFSLLYDGPTGHAIVDYSNTPSPSFGFTDIATPDGINVPLIPGYIYQFIYVHLSSFTGWLLKSSASNGSKVRVSSNDTIPSYLSDKMEVGIDSGLSYDIDTVGLPFDKKLRLNIDTDYDSVAFIQDGLNYKDSLTNLDHSLLITFISLIQSLLPKIWWSDYLVIFRGGERTNSGLNPGPHSINDGYAYINNTLYHIPAISVTTTGSDVMIFKDNGIIVQGVSQLDFQAGSSASGLFDETDAHVVYLDLSNTLQDLIAESSTQQTEINNIYVALGTIYTSRIIIGSWNMDTNPTLTVNLPDIPDIKKVVGIQVTIRNDAGDHVYPLNYTVLVGSNQTHGGFYLQSGSPNTIFLQRTVGGTSLFDSSDFSATGFSRGDITLFRVL